MSESLIGPHPLRLDGMHLLPFQCICQAFRQVQHIVLRLGARVVAGGTRSLSWDLEMKLTSSPFCRISNASRARPRLANNYSPVKLPAERRRQRQELMLSLLLSNRDSIFASGYE